MVCRGCGLVMIEHPPPPERLGEHYGDDYDRFIAAAADASPSRYTNRRDEIQRHKSGGAILDIGCGTGRLLAAMDPQRWELSGIELSEQSARVARQATGATVHVGDVLNVVLPSDCFDVITCFDLLEHVHDPVAVARRVSGWMKPGGILYLQLPNIESGAATVFGSYWYGLEVPRHLFHFSPRSLRTLLLSAGLTETSLTVRRQPFIEYSLRYLVDDARAALGWSPVPLARSDAPTTAWRVMRKILRMTAIPLFASALSLLGDGESIHAVFTKPAQ